MPTSARAGRICAELRWSAPRAASSKATSAFPGKCGQGTVPRNPRLPRRRSAASMNVAIIGGGYAGMAAAVTLAEQDVPVTVYEAGKALGGRARRIEHAALGVDNWLDNGLHILIGAYSETLRLMRLVGADPGRQLLRLPFAWNVHDRFSLVA